MPHSSCHDFIQLSSRKLCLSSLVFFLVPLKVNQYFPFLLHPSPDNSTVTFPALKLWFMFVPGALQVSREGHADTSKKETNCPVLINSSCPSVTFHSTLLPEREKQRTGKKVLLYQDNFVSLAPLSGEERWPLPTGETGNVMKMGLTK